MPLEQRELIVSFLNDRLTEHTQGINQIRESLGDTTNNLIALQGTVREKVAILVGEHKALSLTNKKITEELVSMRAHQKRLEDKLEELTKQIESAKTAGKVVQIFGSLPAKIVAFSTAVGAIFYAVVNFFQIGQK